MRIIAGIYGSRKLAAVGERKLRPTSDRLRETLFNILGPGVEGSVFVDCFAGSGAVGIEALSRGAKHVAFIEKHAAGVALIRKNLRHLEITSGFEVLAMEVTRGLARLSSRGNRADFIFLDPPYSDYDSAREALRAAEQSNLLAVAGRVVLEHARRWAAPEQQGRLRRVRLLEQGDSALSFYELAAQDGSGRGDEQA
jgi:16S rRNA (guanine(966)-N(2))-methyltransferase RsmD